VKQDQRGSPKMANRYAASPKGDKLGGIPSELMAQEGSLGLYECRYCHEEVKQGSVFQHETGCPQRPKRFSVKNELQK
jgi:hypothetical protein